MIQLGSLRFITSCVTLSLWASLLTSCYDTLTDDCGGWSCPDGWRCTANRDSCTQTDCGDRVVQLDQGEQCDDGNTIDNDGCNSICKSELCGNGVVDPKEECDGGDRVAPGPQDTLDCDADCTWRTCGDGHWNSALDPSGEAIEECDNGADANSDALYGVDKGCTANCRLAPYCGDRVLDADREEECDPVGGAETRECNFGELARALGVACRERRCGDGYVNLAEQCDPGENESSDCNRSPSGTARTDCQRSICGDGYTNEVAGEECDDGDAKHRTGKYVNAEPQAVYGKTDRCTESCKRAPFCGDGRLDADVLNEDGEPEECDDGDDNAEASSIYGQQGRCTTECRLAPFCGDQRLDSDVHDRQGKPFETCDDGNTVDGDRCSSTCDDASCGNGVAESEEACDDGNGNNEDDCLTLTHELTNGLHSGTAAECRWNVCGDGYVNRTLKSDGTPVEECDGGHLERIGDSWLPRPLDTEQCDSDCTVPRCGDGHLNPFTSDKEVCDLGSTTDSAQCTAKCKIPGCGDSRLSPGEECDPTAEGFTPLNCDADCTLTVCGDGFVNATPDSSGEPLEECDGGSPANPKRQATETCTDKCKISKCGDRVVNVEATEQCDPGLATPACTPWCTESNHHDGYVDPALGEQCDTRGESKGCDADSTFVECGDGTRNRAAGEACDQGAPGVHVPAEGCLDNCKRIGEGYECPADGGPCHKCEDGIVSGGEVCDEGKNSSGGCQDCKTIAPGYVCPKDSEGNPLAGECSPDCGDGKVVGDEVCDEGVNPTGGCEMKCKKVATGYACPLKGGPCTRK
ncbi:MAG TPA: DUF4215 domain-containing protein [Polyangiaceae bacterium]|nr:DUF4215 domain-containing protein [Polyangiaceae bacterium]